MKSDNTKESNKETMFPDWLFPVGTFGKLKHLCLSGNEQELLGLLYVYKYRRRESNMEEKEIPYEYIREHGAFHVIAQQVALEEKLGEERKFVTNWCINNPGETFDIQNLSQKDYWDLLKYKYPEEYQKTENIAEMLLLIPDSHVDEEFKENLRPFAVNLAKNNNFAFYETYADEFFKEMRDYLSGYLRYEMQAVPNKPKKKQEMVYLTDKGTRLVNWYTEYINKAG